MTRSPAELPHMNPTSPKTVEVTVDEVVFRSEDGRFVVAKANRDEADATLTLVGDLGHVSPGETLRVRGQWTEHPSYGPRFKVQTFTPVIPTTKGGIARYLGSGLVPGVGPALAKRLVARFGDQTLDVITTQSGRLREVDGIGKKRALAIAEAVRERIAEADSMSFLHALGIGPATARRILATYGDETPRVVREDPYQVAEEISGIGFRTADQIGLAAGIARDDPRRAAGAVLHLIGHGADEGHTFLSEEEVARGARELDIPPAPLADGVAALRARRMIVVDGNALYATPLFHAEERVAEAFVRIAGPRRPPRNLSELVRASDEGALTDTQRAAVRMSLEHGLTVLTGGPGTGKTTTVRAIVRAHVSAGRRVALCAPTGRAAKRLTEATGAEAATIHRTLEWNPRTGQFNRNRHTPIEAELVLVDEASMLDVRLGDSLLAAVGDGAHLVLIGDVDQLPPVSPGPVLRELIESGVARVVRLREVFRQAQQSHIVQAAHSILHGEDPTPTPAGTRGEGDLFVVPARDPDTTTSRVLRGLRRMSAAYGFDAKRDVQVLSPMRRGPLGTERLNEVLQEALNPPKGDAPKNPRVGLRVGDKVMQLKNDYERDVYNGDLGEVRRVEGGSVFVSMDGREVQYRIDDLGALALAYASTIHKVQGSEFPAVVIVLHGSHHVLLTRALLYTAVTRAKRLVLIVGDPRALRRAVQNAVSYETNSQLRHRIRKRAQPQS